ncbi:hypothetical protein LZ30DRAFT_733282 [Colletotrichum cereale]|nr:hypothetical protein LZ30DRAFT_733282 [Colletotrichum cereale]
MTWSLGGTRCNISVVVSACTMWRPASAPGLQHSRPGIGCRAQGSYRRLGEGETCSCLSRSCRQGLAKYAACRGLA